MNGHILPKIISQIFTAVSYVNTPFNETENRLPNLNDICVNFNITSIGMNRDKIKEEKREGALDRL
jgi:hypothetical protein